MTQAEWEAQNPAHTAANRAAQEASNAQTRADDKAKEIAESEETLRKVVGVADVGKQALETAKASREAKKGRRDLLDNMAQRNGKATDAACMVTAKSMASAAGGFAGVARIPGVVPSIGAPYFLGGADNSAALIGMADAFVGGTSCATLSSQGQAIVTGGAVAMVKSPGAASIGGTGRVLITSAGLVDILSGGHYVAKAGRTAKFQSGGAMTINTSSTLDLKAIGDMAIKSGANASIKSGGAMGIQAGPTLEGSAGQVSFKGKSRAAIEAGDWSATVTPGQAVVGGKTSNCTLSGGSAVLTCGSTVTCTRGSVKIEGPSVRLNGSGGVRVNGARIDLG
jgi:hypothetical protein